MDSAQADLLVKSLQFVEVGGWQVEGYFGKGKSAVVLPAKKDGVEAAIKVFHRELVERYGKTIQLERILREKSLIGAEHPNLVQILDGGECPVTGHLYVVMEKLQYKNLHDVIKIVPVTAVPILIEQVASAARFLEDRGLAHRDIKPENIAVTDDFSRAILLDLGVLRPIGNSNLTDLDQRSFIGTLRYSSPEFLLRIEEDKLEDWRSITFYQLGAVLHDMLMHKVLFDEHSEPYSRLVEAVKSVVPEIHAEDARCVTLANHCLVKSSVTRLELVSWASFQNTPATESASASASRERIKQQQKYFQATTIDEKTPGSVRKTRRKLLDEVCNRVESRIAALMNDLQSFPLRTTKSIKDVENNCCSTCVHFEQDDAKGLQCRLTLMIKLELIDENNGTPVFRGSASATLSLDETTPQQMLPTNHFQSGELQTILDGTVFEKQFLDALENAYKLFECGHSPKIGDICRLLSNGVAA